MYIRRFAPADADAVVLLTLFTRLRQPGLRLL